MADTTVIFADTHCGYLHGEYPNRGQRLELTRLALLGFAAFLHDMRQRINRVICVGDLVEKLYPTPQTDVALARAQLLPIGSILRREGWPFVYIAGNCDPYYDPAIVKRLAAERSNELTGAVAATLSTFLGGPVPLHLPGLCYHDEQTGLLFTHGHAFDTTLGDSFPTLLWKKPQGNRPEQMIVQGSRGLMTRSSIVHLRRVEAEHLLMGRVYEWGCCAFSWLPQRWRLAADARLAVSNVTTQMEAFADSTVRLPCSGVVAGHIHTAVVDRSRDSGRIFVNPGTLTSAFKIEPSAFHCTFASVMRNATSIQVELFQCHGSTIRSAGTSAFDVEVSLA